MATKIKIIPCKEFIEVTADGVINMATSRQLMADISRSEYSATDHELMVDFRDTDSSLSIGEVYELAAELLQHGATFRRKVALLVTPGLNFDRASFFETCSHNRGFSINAFTEYEAALRWVLPA